ncbi:MAG TPA: MlaD family protein [Thermoleophilaceae bacterium]|jgi:ABC-type transporter Mla subunit MlaD
MRRLIALGTLLVACVLAVVLTGAGGDDAKGQKYLIEFDNAFGLVEDGEVKVGGVSAGKITDFDLTDADPPKVAVEVELTGDDFDKFRRGIGPEAVDGVRCGVRQQSLIGEYFIDCQPGTKGPQVADGGRVPVKQTFSTVPLDLINNIQRRPYRERFRLIISELGVGLAGRPDELNEVIRRAHPGLRETTETLDILARQRRFIKSFVEDADEVSAAVEPRKRDLSRWAKETSEVAQVQASRKDSIAEQWRKLPTFLAELQPTAAQLEQTADEQIPLLRKLRTAAPDLRAFLAELGPFSEDSRRSTRALGAAAVEGRRAVDESSEEVAQLRSLAEDLPRFAKPLRQFLQSLDDRSRSIENDPAAGRTAPPAPDKTAYKPGQGMTGFEVIWNYVYFQTLAINPFDDISHLLRIILIQNACAPYAVKPTPEQAKQCGPNIGAGGPGGRAYSPGVFDPDPTDGPATEAASLSPQENIERFGLRRGAGQPEAPALPGQRDISEPQVTLPPNVQELVDSLRSGKPDAPADPTGLQQSGQLLDFLMSP